VADWDCCEAAGQRVTDWTPWLSEERLPQVRGAFAVAWTDPSGTLRLARDAIGERTVYYALRPGGLVFASTIHALLASGLIERRVNVTAVARYLTYSYLPGPETLVDEVMELLAGEMLLYDPHGLQRRRWWQVPSDMDPRTDEDETRDLLRRTLEGAVRRRLTPGLAIGAFLSGGLDSSLVVALAKRLHDAPVKTWSISFGATYPNELAFSSRVAQHCGTEHRIVELPPRTVVHHVDDAIALLSDPIGDPLTVPNAILFREASAEVGEVLNGEGGDPCFGGPKNIPMLLAELLGDGCNAGVADRRASYLRAHQRCYDDLAVMLTPDAAAENRLAEELDGAFTDPRYQHFVSRLMALNVTFKGAHHILPKVDAISAAFGVVPRSPLFDRDVVELACEMSPSLKLRGSVEKYLLKEAVRDLLPAEILARPKSGMLVPVEGWFSGPLLPEARTRLLEGLVPWGLVRRDYLERLLDGKLGGLRPRRGIKIWLLVTLESWLRGVLRVT
jgi:asparagine synthase (glutamine-hydrolysing)